MKLRAMWQFLFSPCWRKPLRDPLTPPFGVAHARAVANALRWYMRNAPPTLMAGEEGLRVIEAERRLSLIVASSNGSKHGP